MLWTALPFDAILQLAVLTPGRKLVQMCVILQAKAPFHASMVSVRRVCFGHVCFDTSPEPSDTDFIVETAAFAPSSTY